MTSEEIKSTWDLTKVSNDLEICFNRNSEEQLLAILRGCLNFKHLHFILK